MTSTLSVTAPSLSLAPKEVGSFLLFFSGGRLSASTDSKPWLFLAFLQSGLLSGALTMQLSLMTTTNYWCQEHCLELFHKSIESSRASALAFCMLCHKHQGVKLKSCFATDDLSRQRLLLLDVSPCSSRLSVWWRSEGKIRPAGRKWAAQCLEIHVTTVIDDSAHCWVQLPITTWQTLSSHESISIPFLCHNTELSPQVHSGIIRLRAFRSTRSCSSAIHNYKVFQLQLGHIKGILIDFVNLWPLLEGKPWK